MLRVSKLTDYGTVVMTYLASEPERVHTANEVSSRTQVAAPTVSKLLKTLTRGGLLESSRGTGGGYRLARAPELISLAEVVGVLEGPVTLTECSADAGVCEQESNCSIRVNWQHVNRVVLDTLKGISLQQMCQPHKDSQAVSLDPQPQTLRAVSR